MFQLRWVDEPCLSPDAGRLAYSVTHLHRELDVMQTHVHVDGARWPGHAPRWSPDGQALAYLAPLPSAPERGDQVWCWEVASRSAACLTRLATECKLHCWSSDGNMLAFVCGGQIFTLKRQDETVLPLFKSTDAIRCMCWLPGDAGLVVVCSDESDSHAHVLLCKQGQPARVLHDNPGPIRCITCAPDGSTLAWIGHDRGPALGVNMQVWVKPLTGAAHALTLKLDRCAGLTTRSDDARGMNPPDLAWVRVGEQARVYFAFADGGSSQLAWVGLDAQVHPVIIGPRSCLAFSLAPHALRVAAVVADDLQPGEVISMDVDGGDARPLSGENDEWRSRVRIHPHAPLPFVASDGAHIEAWLLKPDSAPPGQRLPLIVQIHGGPHYAIGQRFYFEFQRLVAQGYAVLFCNPRGSQGYGEAFATHIRADWAGRDFEDVMECVDHALRDPALDPQRVAVTGASYGGYLTHWLIARSRRFCAAISENGISDLVSNFDNTTNQTFWRWQMDGTPDSQPGRYHGQSPIHAMADARTPLLMIHAEQDVNCPIGQSENLLSALQRAGCVAELQRIPNEGHLMNLLGAPSHRLLRARAVDAWLARWVPIHTNAAPVAAHPPS